ncbi:LysR family transcriptional regulator [Sphingomonas sp. Leaf25]|uniref:LysR family transcriptional regulator n=1 Tax=Sphingomonas sp. Leaf25 TaxID=1735692 RepID=UPI0006FF639D|nr:LysR family transcriptional regulator [Sphingomonas sp. Leaf25]KQM99387.1 LysR family transcriptional regulator [Sphingomonas sp. Leaf25]
MDRWAELQLFVHAADLKSLTQAAERMGMSTSAASRHLASLEDRLDARLINRTTRRLALTEAGQRFHARAQELLAGLSEAEASIREIVLKPTGNLRISASLSFCLEHLEPILPRFTAMYPELTVELVASNRYYDIIENDVDIAIRTRRVEADSSVTIRRLAETRRLLAASPAYLEKHGTPREPLDLRNHKMLIYNLADRPNEFRLRRNGEASTVTVNAFLTSNDGQIIKRAALHDMGILAQPTYIIETELAEGRLVRVLDDWDLPRLTVNIAYPARAHLPAKVRLFIDYLAADFQDRNYEARWTR